MIAMDRRSMACVGWL